jgi:hypothetical protein
MIALLTNGASHPILSRPDGETMAQVFGPVWNRDEKLRRDVEGRCSRTNEP